MALTNTAVFTQTPKRGYNQVTTADSGLDTPTTNQKTIFTAGANGSKVFEITVQGFQASMSSGIVRIFAGTSSTTGHLIDEFQVNTVLGSSTVPMFRVTKQYDNLLLAANDLLIATTSVTQNLGVTAWYADF